jgi:protein-tyrosine phosphatase
MLAQHFVQSPRRTTSPIAHWDTIFSQVTDDSMIDLHLHVLPGIDDGARSLDESRAMFDRLRTTGFTHLVATPHLMEPLSIEYHQLVLATMDALRPVAAEYGLSLGLGYEHLLVPGLANRLQANEPSTLDGSNAVLVELPFIGWPRHADSSLFELRAAGYRPVLAHPERYVEVQGNPELALRVAEQGTALQLTSASFVGVYGKAAEKSAKTLLEHGLNRDAIIVLSTDAHSDGQRLAKVPAGLDWIRRNLADGSLIVEWASTITPAHLLNSLSIPTFDQWLNSRPSTAGERNRDSLSAQSIQGRRRRNVFGRISRLK